MNIRSFPERIVLELTPLCNLSCSMCPRHYVKDSYGYMDKKLYKKLIDEISEENPTAIVLPFWRGESCMHPQFVELVDYTINKGLRVHISTNGHYMSDKFIDVFIRCEFITFSLHDNRGYNNAMKFVNKKQDTSNCTTQISFVDTEKSTQKFLNECATSIDLKGFDSVRLYHEHTVNGEFGNSKLDSDQDRTFCPKLEHTFVVSADGKYSRCNHIWDPENEGNLYASSIKEIWNSDRITQIRDQYPDKQCAPCDQWSGHTNGEVWRKSETGNVTHTVYSVAEQVA